jgi:hypothetical protein
MAPRFTRLTASDIARGRRPSPYVVTCPDCDDGLSLTDSPVCNTCLGTGKMVIPRYKSKFSNDVMGAIGLILLVLAGLLLWVAFESVY